MWRPIKPSKQNEIIYTLMRERNKPKRFEELRKLCEKELKSRTTFDLYLKELVRKGVVTRTVKSRKNVLYQLNARNPEMQALTKQEKEEEKIIEYLNVNLPKWPKPESEEERRAQFCETLASLVATPVLDPEYFLFRFIENRANPRGVPVSYLEYEYQKVISSILFKTLPRDLEKLRRRDPKLFEYACMALARYRHETFPTGRLLYELTELESADALHMKQDELSEYKHELDERIQRIYGSRNWLQNGPYRGSSMLRIDYVRRAIIQWMNTAYEDLGFLLRDDTTGYSSKNTKPL